MSNLWRDLTWDLTAYDILIALLIAGNVLVVLYSLHTIVHQGWAVSKAQLQRPASAAELWLVFLILAIRQK